jgi:hypothetical protein
LSDWLPKKRFFVIAKDGQAIALADCLSSSIQVNNS